MSELFQNIRYTLRLLRKSPGYTLVVVLVLAVGIGANTALFSVVNSVLLHPLPYPQADRLTVLLERDHDRVTGAASLPNYLDWRAGQHSFTDLALVRGDQFNCSAPGQTAARVAGATITANYLDVLGVRPTLGRNLTEAEDIPGGPAAVLISDALWRQRFGANPAVLGARMVLDGVPREIVGVLPPTVEYPYRAGVFVPLGNLRADKEYTNRGNHEGFKTLGRLRPGVTLAQARDDLNAIAAELERRYPDSNTGWRLEVRSLLDYKVGGYRRDLLLLLGAVGCVLLIACTNVANLQLARATTRRRELVVRAALGAGRRRLVRQTLTESAVLGALGGLAGLLVATWVLDAILALGPAGEPRFQAARLDGAALAFASVLALGSGLLAGVWPAWRITGNAAMASALRENSARGASGEAGQGRFRAGLVVVQIALAVVLLTGSGLLLRSFWRARHEPLGFRPEGLLTAWFSLPLARYDSPEKQAAFLARLVEGVRAVPGVSAAAVSATAPFSGDESDGSFHVTGTPPDAPGQEQYALYNCTSPGYFQTMGMPLLRGSDFAAQDGLGRAMKVVIDDALARRYFPGQDPVGRHLDKDFGSGDGTVMTVIGVVPHVHTEAPGGDPEMTNMVQMYFCAAQVPRPEMSLLVRAAAGDPADLIEPVRRVAASLDPELPLSQVRTMDEGVAADFASQRSTAVLLGGLASVALLLASTGLYGVMALSVTQRTRELGIRLALGAPRARVLRLVLRQGAVLTGIGVSGGLVAALFAGRLLASALYGVTPTDPATLLVVPGVLALAALLACWLPAYRATRVDPMVALREE